MVGIVVGDVEIDIDGDTIVPFMLGSVMKIDGIPYRVSKDLETGQSPTEPHHKITLVRCDEIREGA